MSRADVIEALRCRGVFRARDFDETGSSRGWLQEPPLFSPIVKVARGIYRHPEYTPTRYELIQVRAPRAVSWGPSALWLQGSLPAEPDLLWVAFGLHTHPPRHLSSSVIVVRCRRPLERCTVRQRRTALELLVQTPLAALEAIRRRLRRGVIAQTERDVLTEVESTLSDPRLAQRVRPEVCPGPAVSLAADATVSTNEGAKGANASVRASAGW